MDCAGQTESVIGIIAEVAVLLLLMDFLMYLFHFAAHLPLVYKVLHGKNTMNISVPTFKSFCSASFGNHRVWTDDAGYTHRI